MSRRLFTSESPLLQRAVRIRTVHNSNIAEQQEAGAFSASLQYRYDDSGTCGAFCLGNGKRQCISLFMFALFFFFVFFVFFSAGSVCRFAKRWKEAERKRMQCVRYASFSGIVNLRLLRVSHLWYGSRRLLHRKRNAGGIPHP